MRATGVNAQWKNPTKMVQFWYLDQSFYEIQSHRISDKISITGSEDTVQNYHFLQLRHLACKNETFLAFQTV